MKLVAFTEKGRTIYAANYREMIYKLRSIARLDYPKPSQYDTFRLRDGDSNLLLKGSLNCGFVWFVKNNTLHHI